MGILEQQERNSFIKVRLVRRLIAGFIDHFICFFIITIILGLIKTFIYQIFYNSLYFGICFLIMTLIIEIYYFTCEYFLKGQTPGKMLLNIKVININNELRIRSLFTRNFLRCLYLLPPLLFLPDIIFMLFDKQGRRIGDLVADTVVVKEFID